jgi:hypothetical protein
MKTPPKESSQDGPSRHVVVRVWMGFYRMSGVLFAFLAVPAAAGVR